VNIDLTAALTQMQERFPQFAITCDDLTWTVHTPWGAVSDCTLLSACELVLTQIDQYTDTRPWRVGNHWRVTIVAEGHGAPDEHGRRLGDTLVATAQSRVWAQMICDEHNANLTSRRLHAQLGLSDD
jgi:hypothetical protein